MGNRFRKLEVGIVIKVLKSSDVVVNYIHPENVVSVVLHCFRKKQNDALQDWMLALEVCLISIIFS